MQQQELQLSGVEGIDLRVRVWGGDLPPIGIVVILHGLAGHSGHYQPLAQRLVDEGYVVYGLDQRGHGNSGGRRANIGRFAYLIADLHKLILQVKRTHPGIPVFLLGHSMGGAVALGYTQQYPTDLKGLILSAPALTVCQLAKPWEQYGVRFLSTFLPNMGVWRFPIAEANCDPTIIEIYKKDPFYFNGLLPAVTLAEILRAVPKLVARAREVQPPVLILHGAADTVTPFKLAEPIYAQIGCDEQRMQYVYEGLYHKIFQGPGRDQVFDHLVAWLDLHL